MDARLPEPEKVARAVEMLGELEEEVGDPSVTFVLLAALLASYMARLHEELHMPIEELKATVDFIINEVIWPTRAS